MPGVEPSRRYESPLRKQQAKQTRDVIRQGALDLLRESDATDFSMPDVAKRADVSLRTVYRHFPTKGDLLSSLLEVAPVHDAVLSATTPEELARAVTQQFEAMADDEPIFRTVNTTSAQRQAQADNREIARAPAERSMAPVIALLDSDAATMLMAIVNLLTSSVGLFYMQDTWDLTTDDASDVAGWAISVLADEASRSRHVGLDHG